MASVALQSVRKAYGAAEVIPNLNLRIDEGTFTVLVGPSGCGKSTLLRMIAGLEETTGGRISIGDRDVTRLEPSQRGISMVFQSYALYPHMNVAENIGFSLKLARVPKAEIANAVTSAAKMLKLEHLLERRPADLSGGQRQRVAIGRAIVRQPQVFLFDEPLSNLDAAHRAEMRVELTELHERLASTSIYVTHDQIEAMTMADQIVVLNAGHIEQVGSPEEVYDLPATPFVASFIGAPKINFFEGPIAQKEECDLLGVRPENLLPSRENGDWKVTITHFENLGSERLIYTNSAETGRCISKIGSWTGKSGDWHTGQEIYLSPDRNALHRFRDGMRV